LGCWTFGRHSVTASLVDHPFRDCSNNGLGGGFEMKAERNFQDRELQAAIPVSGQLATAEVPARADDLSDVLSEFAQTMLTDFPIQKILDHLVKRIVDIMPITSAGVTLIAPGLQPRYVAASDDSALRFEMLQTELGEGPCLAAYRTGEAVAVADLNSEDRFRRFAPRALEAGLTAVFTFPLRHEDVQLGALDLYRETAGALSEESMSAAQTLADVAAAYLINAQARADLQDSSDQSREASLHDALTGLPNRVLLLQLLRHAFRVARRTGKISAVLFVDLDLFKEVNDTHGHQIGDELLVAAAERMTGLLRPGDSLARLSGDEFVVLCEELDDPGEADAIAVRLKAELARPFVLSGVQVDIAASIGIAFTGSGNDVPEDLLRDADLAMYRSKHNGGGGAGVRDLRDLHIAGHRAGLASGLPGAEGRGELHIEYQPIVAALDGRLAGVEALLRWTHPDRGIVSPTVFIPFAEQSGQIVELGQWVLEQAWSDHHRWQTADPSNIGMSVNVSAHQFMSVGFVASVAAVLDRAPVDPGLLTLEVTERVFVRDEERALVVLSELKNLGVKLALDDFGTGYSSLGYLNTLPIDTIKLNQVFVGNLTDDPGSHTILASVIGLAHGLGMTVVCEGIETAKQHTRLIKLGSDFCQGFYFAKPMPAPKLGALIQRQADEGTARLPALA
jgi:diguanylate cyclase (GGDEF)-like protein